MKAEQRFHLNRLADKLVTPERFGGSIFMPPPEGFLPIIFDEMADVHSVFKQHHKSDRPLDVPPHHRVSQPPRKAPNHPRCT